VNEILSPSLRISQPSLSALAGRLLSLIYYGGQLSLLIFKFVSSIKALSIQQWASQLKL
jgi:hypothetical protein